MAPVHHPLILLILLSVAQAAPQVVVRGETPCPDGPTLAAALPQQTTARFEVGFARAGRVWVATVLRLDAPGRRVLRSVGDTCGPLAEAVTLTMAMTVDPLMMPDLPRTKPNPDRPTAPKLEGWAVRVDAGVSVGLTPAATALGLSAGWRGRRWSLGVQARFQPPATDELGGGTTATVGLAAGRLLGCYTPWAPLDLCAVGMGGRLWAKGAGFARNDSTSAPLLAGGLHLRGTFARWGSWTAAITLEGLAVVSTMALTYDERVVWRTERVHGGGGLSLGAVF